MTFNVIALSLAAIWAAGALYTFLRTFAALYESRRPGASSESLFEILVMSVLIGVTWFVSIPMLRGK